MRGKVYEQAKTIMCPRITPAYAGKRVRKNEIICCSWDHPRLCGEKVNLIFQMQIQVGITPAYAGKSYSQLPDIHKC